MYEKAPYVERKPLKNSKYNYVQNFKFGYSGLIQNDPFWSEM